MTYQCLYCGVIASFDTLKGAFEAGWDIAPRFSIGPLCPNCPTMKPFMESTEKEE